MASCSRTLPLRVVGGGGFRPLRSQILFYRPPHGVADYSRAAGRVRRTSFARSFLAPRWRCTSSSCASYATRSVSTSSTRTQTVDAAQTVDADVDNWRPDEATFDRAEAMQLFAYPSSRRVPLLTLSFLAGAVCLSCYVHWRLWRSEVLCSASAVGFASYPAAGAPAGGLPRGGGTYDNGVGTGTETAAEAEGGHDLTDHHVLTESPRERLRLSATEFVDFLDTASRSPLLSNLVRMEPPTVSAVFAATLLGCGTFVERARGPLVLGAVMIVGACGAHLIVDWTKKTLLLWDHEDAPRRKGLSLTSVFAYSPDGCISANSGVLALAGFVVAARYGKCAVYPGLHVPLSWLLAPLLVFEGIQVRDHVNRIFGQYYAGTGRERQDTLVGQGQKDRGTVVVGEESSSGGTGGREGTAVVRPGLQRHDAVSYRQFLIDQMMKTACDEIVGRNFHENRPSHPAIESFVCDAEPPPRLDDNSVYIDFLGFLLGCVFGLLA